MCHDNYWPPPTFEYVDLWQYSNEEIHDYIKILCEFMNNRIKIVEENKSCPKTDITIDDIPF